MALERTLMYSTSICWVPTMSQAVCMWGKAHKSKRETEDKQTIAMQSFST